jgi:hypothetical protein
MASSGISVSATANSGGDNTVIIFDADVPSAPQDPDLQVDNGLHILIIPETGTTQDTSPADGLVDAPDDSANGGTIFVRMDTPFFLKSFVFVDHENNSAEAKAYDAKFGGNLITTVPIPIAGDKSIQTIIMNAPNTQRLEVKYKDSGGITNIDLKCAPPKGEGCTPGFWKQSQHFKFWKGYKTTDKFAATFGITGSAADLKIKVDNKYIKLKYATLLDALKAQGGGINALARHAVAALLNASSGINYTFTVAEVKSMVKDAIQSGSSTKIEDTKNKLEKENERDCPFGEECKCEDRKEEHNDHFDYFEKYYGDNKKSFKKGDYKKYLNDYQKYFDEHSKYFVKDDYKNYMDYYKKFLEDNKNNFSTGDYKKYSDKYKKYSSDYNDHDDRCDCDKDDKYEHDDDKYDDHDDKYESYYYGKYGGKD